MHRPIQYLTSVPALWSATSHKQRTQLLADVDYYAARFARRCSLGHHDQEDIRSELIMELCKAAQKYNAAIASPRRFVKGVLTKQYLALCRIHSKRSSRNRRMRAERVNQMRQGRMTKSICPLLRTHIAEVIDSLPPDLRELAFEMQFKSMREIARERGLCHCTVLQQRDRLMRALAKVNVKEIF
jgi:DNA-directed RNA polymerase specialized sigma24 family protein